MMRALYSAATGMIAQQTNIDVISNNLANVNTTGYKKGRPDFDDLLYQIGREPGAPTAAGNMIPTGVQVGVGVRVAATQKMFSQGAFVNTENPFDIAIEGDGFFQVQMPDGTLAYTRDGSWKVDGDGQMVTSDGYLIEPGITIPEEATSISVGEDGLVTVTVPGDTAPVEVGQLELVRFINPAGLKAIGKNLFLETAASGAPVPDLPGANGMGMVAQGWLEMSNVQVVDEMVNMIVAQRAYEANSKSIQTADSMLQIANGLKR